jgi:hypothetical protein
LADIKVGMINKDTILWVTTFTEPSHLGSLKLMIEDSNGYMICLCAYYTVPYSMKNVELMMYFPKGTKIGIK